MKFDVRKRCKTALLLVFIFSLIFTTFPNYALAQTPGCTSNVTTKPMVSAGDNHSVYLKTDGTVWAWGQNNFGQLGNGTTLDSPPLVQVTGLCDAVAISAGTAYTVALKSDGTVWAWGNNAFGQLGDGTTNHSPIPVKTSGISDVAAIAAGTYYTVALKKDGTVWTWGYNASGQLGYETSGSNHSTAPRQVSALSDIKSIAAGFNHAAAVSSSGAVWTWGDNSSSQLGRTTGTPSNNPAPAQVSGLSEAQSLSLGLYYSVALLKDGTVWSWGNNTVGQLGNGTRTTSITPQQVLYSSNPLNELKDVVAIEAGYEHTIAVLSDGTLQAWGSNSGRQIGDGTTAGWRLFAVTSNLDGAAVSVAAGRAHSIAVKSDGTVWTWGENMKYQLGRTTPMQGPDYAPSNTPGQVVEGLVDCTVTTSYKTKPMVAAGYRHSAALKGDGTVWTWGNNEYGQLGNGTYGDHVAPARVPNLCYVKAIQTGYDFTMALKNDGTVWAWGDNANGQLGNGASGTGNRNPNPVQVADLTGVSAISAGRDYAVALKKDGTVWTWGAGNKGQLGYEPSGGAVSSKPRRVGSLSAVKAIAAQDDHAAVLKADGTVWTWGNNSSKELGYETSVPGYNPTPRQVPNLSHVSSIASRAGSNTVVLKSDGTVWDFGSNAFSQLGSGKKAAAMYNSATPVRVIKGNNAGLENVASVAAGYSFSLALLKNGSLWGWGFNANGQLGNGTYEYDQPFAHKLLMQSVVSVSGGYAHSLAIKKDGTVWSWGNNNHYQLGRKSGSPDIPNNIPGPVEGLGELEDPTILSIIPINVGMEGIIGQLADDTPVAARGSPITITAFFDNPKAVKVTLLVTDAEGHKYEASMSAVDDENWTHTFVPNQVGLMTSPLEIQIIPHYPGNVTGKPIKYGMVLIDPSGIVYNANQGNFDKWPLPHATVILQYFDPALGAAGQWADMNGHDYEGRFEPVINPQITGEDGRYAWDTAAGQYRVVVSRPGFETAISRVVTVPPPVLDLHVGLVPTDGIKPTLSVSGVTYSASYTQPVTVEWVASDDSDGDSGDASGVRFVEYRLDDGEAFQVQDGIGSITVNEPGIHTVHITAVDHAGNSYTESFPFTITEPAGELYSILTFNSNGGSPVSSQTVKNGSTAVKPADPVRAGYTFAGWYADAELVSEFDFTTAIIRDMTVYAKWAEKGNAGLSALSISGGVLSPAFHTGTTRYTAAVADSVSSVTVTAAVYDAGLAGASVTASVYNSAGTLSGGPFTLTSSAASPPLSLSVGANTIKIVVTDPNGVTTTYEIRVTRAAPSSPGGSYSGSTSGSNTTQLIIQIDGKAVDHIAKATTSREGGTTEITVVLDASKLTEQLAQAKDRSTVVIPVTAASDQVTFTVTGDAVKALENKHAVLEVRTPHGTYIIPAAEIQIDSISKRLGRNAKPSDIIVAVEIAKSSSATVKLLENTAAKERFKVVVPPVDFNATASLGGNTVNLNKFNTYVRREIPVPEDIDPARITTAVVRDADGTIRHVPTFVALRDGKYYAVVHSLTNSTYALIERSTPFADVQNHWAEEEVNDLGNRMIVNGADANYYRPDASITRAELTAVVVRALGLAANGTGLPFEDVKSGDWYYGAVAKAYEYGIITGYEDGAFRPAKTITRQEAILVIARAMKLAGMEKDLSDSEADRVLAPFADRAEVASWAKQPIAAAVQSGIAAGSYSGLQPGSNMTRAEVARIVHQLLLKAKLIVND